MTTVGSRELKTRLGQYLDLVRKGESFVVTAHGRPVAELRPIPAAHIDLDARLAELAALGIVTLPSGRPLTYHDPLKTRSGKLVSDTILEDREDRF
jgi:prevent-host-death family protein